MNTTKKIIQSEIDFTVPSNSGAGNQKILDDNRLHFSKQARWALIKMMSGESVSGFIAWKEFNIQDLRARIYGLKSKGIEVSERKIENGNGAKEWFMTEDQINKNKQILNG